MSFTVSIVVPPVPASGKAAWAALEGILERRDQGPRSPEFQGLHDQLVARYPCICSLADDSGVWSDGPLINNFEHGVAVIGIRYDQVEKVLPFLVRTATDLGFVVFDDQNGKIHRPRKAKES
jgi:hypothetical protein